MVVWSARGGCWVVKEPNSSIIIAFDQCPAEILHNLFRTGHNAFDSVLWVKVSFEVLRTLHCFVSANSTAPMRVGMCLFVRLLRSVAAFVKKLQRRSGNKNTEITTTEGILKEVPPFGTIGAIN
ncbi:hypothetical protein H6P81_020629 [Aristolochia fimbriata]|uniref:Uncharacterized protein n=1 Tax=Aristolochia fimbriata TaxID=158543 RepID=A0AAV7DV93_ARIFI|nr:hypothetical protein H6P81_020629 [Aristolochia fimbriata]